MTVGGRQTPGARSPYNSDAIEEAAGWMARLLAEDVSQQDRINCERWRNQHPSHEQAWQRICQVSGVLSEAPVGSGEVLEKTRRAVTSRRRFLQFLTFAGIGVTATWLGIGHTQYGRSLMAMHRTGVGETRAFTLEDGTQLTLNTDTAVDVDFTTQERRIVLHQGEIRVETGIESPRRRFVVDTHVGQLVALGTTFNVRQYPNHAQVAVLEGAVEARPEANGAPRRIDAGQQTRLFTRRAATPETLHPAALVWHQGKLVARSMRVADFVEEISRYRPGFTLCDDAVADLTISGVFSLQNTDRALNALADSLPVALQYRTDYWVKVIPAG